MSRPPRRPPLLAGLALCLAALGLSGCSKGPVQVGLEPTREWAAEIACPVVACSGRPARLYGTINEPAGTVYGVTGSDGEVFVICRWPAAAVQPACEQVPPGGTSVVGEAAVYLVEA